MILDLDIEDACRLLRLAKWGAIAMDEPDDAIFSYVELQIALAEGREVSS